MHLSIKAPNEEKFKKFHNSIKENSLHKSSSLVYDVVKINNLEITFFKNLTIYFKGNISVDLEKKILILLDEKLYFGSDEVGTGENFGPIIVCGVEFDSLENKFKALLLGIKDSKKLNLNQIDSLSSQIKKLSKHYCNILEPEKFNVDYKKINNIKKILAIMHYDLQLKSEKLGIIDQFVTKKLFLEYLKKENLKKEILFETKAENKYLEVAAASIIAKSIFNNWVIDFCKKNKINLEVNEKINLPKLWENIKTGKIILQDKNSFVKMWNKLNSSNL